MPNSPELDWRCSHNHLPAECPHARCGYREALVEVERLRAALDLIEWLSGETVDTIYVDDGRIIDVAGENLISVLAKARLSKQFCTECKGAGVTESAPAGAGHSDDLAEYVPCATCMEREKQSQAPDDQRERGGGE